MPKGRQYPELASPAESFPAPVGVRAFGKDGGTSDRESRNVSNRVQIGGAVEVANPKTFLAGTLKAGIVTLALGSESVDTLEAETVAVNGKTVVVGNVLVLCTATVFLAVVPIFVVTGALTGFRLAEGTAVFLTQAAMSVGSFSVLVHGKTGVTDKMTGRELGGILRIAFVQGDNSVPMVEVFDGVVDMLGVIALVADEGTLLKGDDIVCLFEYRLHHGRIGNISGSGKLIERQPGNAIDQDVIFVAPVQLIIFLIMLVRGGMDTQGTV